MVISNKFLKSINISVVKCFLKSNNFFFQKFTISYELSCFTKKCMGKCLKVNKSQYLVPIQFTVHLNCKPLLNMKNKNKLFCKYFCAIFFLLLQLTATS